MDMNSPALQMTVFLTPVIFLYKELLKCLVLLKSAFFLQIGILLFTKKPVTNLMKNMSVLFYKCYSHSFQLMKEWRGLVFQICPMKNTSLNIFTKHALTCYMNLL